MNLKHPLRRAALSALLAAISTTSVARTARAEAIVSGNDVTFRLDTRKWEIKPKKVAVVGGFQGWNKDATPLADADRDGVWEAKVHIPGTGPQSYKFVVDGERYLTDETGDRASESDDSFGGKNSGFTLGAAAPVAADAPKVAAAGQANAEGALFTFDASSITPKPTSVHLAGSFNGWSTSATPMARGTGDVWSIRIPLEEGQHAYKFVLDGPRWIPDPKADPTLETDDGNGGKNSGMIAGYDARKAPPAKDNEIDAAAVQFKPTDPADVNVFAPGQVRIRVRALANDVKQANVRVVGGSAAPVALTRLGQTNGLDVFGGIVRATPDASTMKFEIDLVDGSARRTLKNGADAFSVDPRPTFETPDWAKHAVWYQVFPERFRNGEPSNDPGDKADERLIKWTSDWWKAQPGEAGGKENFYDGKGDVWNRRYGGDVQGLRQSLPYLRELGINAIYLNPIFEAESMHKYDTADYRHIDDNFGVKGDLAKLTGETGDPATWKWSDSDKLFLDFVAEAHRQGFKVILDGVFNHVGRAHPFFQDVLANGKRSPYASWFEITDWGDEKNWRKMDDPYAVHGKPGGIEWQAWDKPSGALPVFKKDERLGLVQPVRDHIFAITQRWLAPDGDASRGVDGWRLDVPGDIPHPFWRDWRKLVKGTHPDAYITGEIWPWAQPWLNAGDQFDAVMNYQFAMPAQQFFVDEKTQIKPSIFASKLVHLEMAYPFQVALAQQNLYDSHDTDRLASMFVNPDRQYDAQNREQDNAKERGYSPAKPTDEQWRRLEQAAAMQFTYVGAPMIYYGTEAGMWSPDDPSNRQPMIWRDLMPYADPQVTFKADLFAYYQRLIAVREALPALNAGLFVPLMFDDERNVLVYRRGSGPDAVYVAINRSKVPQQVDVPISDADAIGPLVNWLDDAQAKLRVPDTKALPTARPTIAATGAGGIVARGGAARVDLPAFGTAILSAAKKNVAAR